MRHAPRCGAAQRPLVATHPVAHDVRGRRPALPARVATEGARAHRPRDRTAHRADEANAVVALRARARLADELRGALAARFGGARPNDAEGLCLGEGLGALRSKRNSD